MSDTFEGVRHQFDVFDAIAEGARAESSVWAASLRAPHERELVPVFSPLAPGHFALGLETVYEAYLTHYGTPRLVTVNDADEAILLGDYLYAHGLVRVAEAGGVRAVSVMAELISRCAALRADGAAGDGNEWVAAARALGGAPDDEAVALALARHSARVAP